MKKVVYQGEPGANSHLAVLEACPDHEPVPCPTFEDCFAAVSRGTADLAMIPVDNSLAGRVADIHHLLPTSRLHIVGEHFLPIRFQLMAVKGARLKDIRSVHSHIHALGQCRKIIREHRWTPMIEGDTAGAARIIAEANDKSQAALAPRLAAGLYGLDILMEDVEDEAHNTTRFLILSKKDIRAPANNGPVITTFIFRVRNVPAALYKAMGGFATNGVNMTKLEVLPARRPVLRNPVLRRRGRPPRRATAGAGLGGTRLLLDGAPHSRRLPGQRFPQAPGVTLRL